MSGRAFTFHPAITVSTSDGPCTVEGWTTDTAPGLAVTQGLAGAGFMVTHIPTGRRIGAGAVSFSAALGLLDDVARLTDWNVEKPRAAGLRSRVLEILAFHGLDES